jgi:hypothetical protein
MAAVDHGHPLPNFLPAHREGGALYRARAEPDFIRPSVFRNSEQDQTLTRQENDLSLGTRVLRHLPLGPRDRPGTHEGEQRRKFRNMINSINELDRLYPDLEFAERNRWYYQITKLKRHIHSLERGIQQRLVREANCPFFEELAPNYPQLWKYLNSSFHRRPRQSPAVLYRPAPRRQHLESRVFRNEHNHLDNSRAALREPPAFRHSRQPVPRKSPPGRTVDFFKQEDEDRRLRDIDRLGAGARASSSQVQHVQSQAKRVKREPQESDSDDCVIVAVRKVGQKSRRRRRGRSGASRLEPLDYAAAVASILKAGVPTRSLRSRDVPLRR